MLTERRACYPLIQHLPDYPLNLLIISPAERRETLADLLGYPGEVSRRSFLKLLGVGAVAGLVGGCRTRETPQREIQRKIQCLSLEPSIEDCATKIDYRVIKPRIKLIEGLLSGADISEKSRKTIGEVLKTISEMQENGMIHWYLFNQEVVAGQTVTGKERGADLGIGKEFLVYLILPQKLDSFQSEVLGVTSHEMLHAVRAYERFRDKKVDPVTDKPPPEEEYEAEYYGELIVYLAVTQEFSREAKDSVLARFGIDMAAVVYFLDQKGVGPENEVYQYLSDLRLRYLLERRREMIESFLKEKPSELELKEELQESLKELESSIRSIEEKWEGFPQRGSEDYSLIEEIILKGWVSDSFFTASYLDSRPR